MLWYQIMPHRKIKRHSARRKATKYVVDLSDPLEIPCYIEKIEVDYETNKKVIVDGTPRAKRSQHFNFLDSKQEAYDLIYNTQREICTNLRYCQKKANAALEKIKAYKRIL